MTYIRVVNKTTGKTGLLPEESFDPNRYSLVGEEKKGIVASLAKPFTNTAERVGGAGEAILRQLLLKQIEKASGEGDTDKMNRLGKIAEKESAITRGEKDYLTDPLQIAKDTAGVMSWGVPVGKGTSVLGKPIATTVGKGGLTAGALGGFGYSDETSPEGLAKSTAIGAGTGYATAKIINKLFSGKGGASKATDKTKLEKVGLDLKKGAIRPQAGKGPSSVTVEDDMVKFLSDKKISGSPMEMRYGVDKAYKQAYQEVGNILDNTPSKTYDVGTVKTIIKDQISEVGNNFVPGDTTYEKLLERELSLLDKQAQNGGITAKGIHKAIGNLNKQLNRAYAKTQGMSGAPLTPVEGVRLDVSDVLHDMLAEAAPTKVGQLSKEMSMLHKLSPGLQNASQEAANIFGVPMPGVGQGVLTAQNKVGDVALSLDDILKGGTSRAPLLSTKIGSKLPAAAGALTQGRESGEIPQMPSQPTSTGKSSAVMSEDQYKALVLNDLIKNGGKNLSKLEAAYKVLGGAGEASAESKKAVAKLENAEALIDQFTTSLSEIGMAESSLGARTGGTVRKLGASTGLIPDANLRAFSSLREGTKPILARTFGEVGNLTAQEQENAIKLIPDVTDSREEAIAKLTQLRAIISQMKANYQ